MKKFIITIDTEGDNLWNWKAGQKITTENSKYIDRFQSLCEEFGFVPTYLTNYEMANDDRWVSYAKKKVALKQCEIGLHIHAWNSPPDYPINNTFGGNPYITEYPDEIVLEKISFLSNFLCMQFEQPILCARSGRWATSETYFRSLIKNGIYIDCSVIPDINLSRNYGSSIREGPDYRYSDPFPTMVFPELIEVPMSTRNVKWFGEGSFKHRVKTLLLGEQMWLRPITLSKQYLKTLIDYIDLENRISYLMFMIHSSELMPGGSPYFQNEEAIDQLYMIIEWVFNYVSKLGYEGCGLVEYANLIKEYLI